MKLLNGYKTYIVAALGAITFFCARIGLISVEIEANIYILLGIAGVATIRSAIKKS